MRISSFLRKAFRLEGATLFVLLALVVTLVGVELAAGAPNGGLFYAPLLTLGVQDAGPDGDGVTRVIRVCPANHPNETGGGAVINGDQSDLDLELKSSGPPGDIPPNAGSPGHWVLNLNNSSGSRAQATVNLVCAKGAFVYVDKTAHVASTDEGERSVTCPGRTKLAGGGTLAIGGDHTTEISSSAPEGNGPHPDAWDGAINTGLGGAVTLRVTAVCAKHGTYRVVRTPRIPLPNGAQIGATARCPQRSHVSSGGVRITGLDDGLEVAASAAFDNNDGNATPDDGWTGVGNNEGSGHTEFLQVFAVCKT